MKKNIKQLIPLTLLTLCPSIWAADGAPSWRLMNSTYNTAASKLVTKDYGYLTININTNCAATYSDAENKLKDTLQELVRLTEKSFPSAKIKNKNPELSFGSHSIYALVTKPKQYHAAVVNNCEKGRPLNDEELKTVDQTATAVQGSATLIIEASKNLSELTTLRQKLNLHLQEPNASGNTQVNVGQEQFALSAETEAQTENELESQTALKGSLKNRLEIDREASGGFAEEYVTQVEDSYANYRSITPSIDAEGRSVVKAYYNFQVKYLPGNLAANGEKAPENLLGSTQREVAGQVITDTDYYVGQLEISTGCQASAADATAAVVKVYDAFKARADEVIDPKNQSNPERVEFVAGNASPSRNWKAWTTEKVPGKRSDGADAEIKAVSYISRCTNEVVKTDDTETLAKTYEFSQKIVIITKNFAGLKALEAAAAQHNEAQAGSKKVLVSSRRPSPRLNPRKHFEAVEVLAYKNALDQLLAPQGSLAKYLLDQVASSEAYYALESYQSYSDAGGGGRKSFGAAAPSAPGRGLESADASQSLDQYSVLATGDDNIPQAELTRNKAYQLTFRPNKHLVQVLQEKRAAQGAPNSRN